MVVLAPSRRSTMKRIVLIAFALAVVLVPVAAADTPWTVQFVSFVGDTFPVNQGGECAGEPILITSGGQEIRSMSTTSQGGTEVTIALSFVNLVGVGTTTGTRYVIAGRFNEETVTTLAGVSEHTIASGSVIVGPGPDNNRLAHGVLHLTAANGTLTADVIRTEVVCR
jgi:hypothetical protein